MKTTLHHYRFASAKDPGYKAMVRTIEANAEGRGHWMNSSGPPNGPDTRDLPGNHTEEVELDPTFLFDNQWNEADRADGNAARRLFDWYEEWTDAKFKRGHWLEITPEMAQARRNTVKCGFCGKHHGPYHTPAPESGFCEACLDSEYLKPTDFPLLRLRPVIQPPDRNGPPMDMNRPLTEAELADLMPRYVQRQTTGTDSRAKKARDRQRQNVLDKFAKETRDAKAERDGMLWLWDHGVSLDNVIYYPHAGKFCFGWRSPLAPEVKSALLDLISEFPFEYEIKAGPDVPVKAK
jgi:hypothetical protein